MTYEEIASLMAIAAVVAPIAVAMITIRIMAKRKLKSMGESK